MKKMHTSAKSHRESILLHGDLHLSAQMALNPRYAPVVKLNGPFE